MPGIETIFSPALIRHHDLEGRTAVIIDVLRATSSICYALHAGARSLVPVSTPEACMGFRSMGFLCAAERNGIKLDGFDMGNSPEEFSGALVQNRDIAITTTNGTYALLESAAAERILIGSFLNLEALASYLQGLETDITLICAGWKNKVNLEDSLFAGALAASIKGYETDCDSTLMALELWKQSRGRLKEMVGQSSHARRFLRLGIDDLALCLDLNRCPVIPVYDGVRIIELGANS